MRSLYRITLWRLLTGSRVWENLGVSCLSSSIQLLLPSPLIVDEHSPQSRIVGAVILTIEVDSIDHQDHHHNHYVFLWI